MQRRDFIRTGALLGAAAALPFPVFGNATGEKARIGFIGVGLRGRNHLNNLLMRDDVLIPAICDLDPDALEKAQALISKSGHQKVEEYSGDEYAYREMLQRSDLDGVLIATPWLWHTRMSVDAMRAGKYAGVEVSAANTTGGMLGPGQYLRRDRCTGDDHGECLLPQRCDGCAANGQGRTLRRITACPLRIPARFAGSKIQ